MNTVEITPKAFKQMRKLPRDDRAAILTAVKALKDWPDVRNVKPGDRCCVEPYINCGQCYSCRRGHTNCCEFHKTLGVMCDGGMTERIILPARKLHTSTKLTYEQLALVETLAIGCHAINRGRPTREDSRRHDTEVPARSPWYNGSRTWTGRRGCPTPSAAPGSSRSPR